MAWVEIATTDEISVGGMKQVIVYEEELALFHLDDAFHVTSNISTHRKTDGSLHGNIVACPRHGGKFDVKSGTPVAGPCVIPLKTYTVDIRDNKVWIDY